MQQRQREQSEGPWAFVPPQARRTVATPAAKQARLGWQWLRRLLHLTPAEGGAPAMSDSALNRPPAALLDRLLPPIDWREAALALDARLREEWGGAGDTGVPVRLLVLPPCGGLVAILREYARLNGLREVAPPPPRAVLDGDTSVIDGMLGDVHGGPLVLPQLAHWYLRHVDGLALWRRLLREALGGRLGRCVIGCDGWTFAYLQRVWPLPEDSVLTLQAFDGSDLARLLGALATPPSGRVRFRHAASGRDILVAPHGDDDAGAGADLNALAAHCRGNPALAWYIMRGRLRSVPQAAAEGAAPGGGEGNGGDSRAAEGDEVVWVAPDYGEVSLPAELAGDGALLLHAMLLHAGLPADLAGALLPLDGRQLDAQLQDLRLRGIVALEAGRWQVTAAATLAAGRLLRSRGFLSDPL